MGVSPLQVETTEALDNLAEIVDASDGIMVARGDLGVEVPLAQVATWQKDMVQYCLAAGKPVIVATQMLESMQSNPRPTRAEVSGVTPHTAHCPYRSPPLGAPLSLCTVCGAGRLTPSLAALAAQAAAGYAAAV